jgi:hypothetical protein
MDKPETELVVISIVLPKPVVRPESLGTFSIANMQRRLKDVLAAANVDCALGGIDFSFNEDQEGRYEPFWCPHAYIITSTENRKQLSKLIGKNFSSTKAVVRPVQISSFQNTRKRRSYAWKMHFYRRIGYADIDRPRECRNTGQDKLRAKENLELFVYLDRIGLASRVAFVGAKPIISSKGIRIKRS